MWFVPNSLIFLLASILSILVLRVYLVWREIRQNRQRGRVSEGQQQQRSLTKALIVLGSGGHTTELLEQCRMMDASKYQKIYCLADSDTTSAVRIPTPDPVIMTIPRARTVGQSYASSIPSTIYASFYSFRLIYRIQPDLLLCNGPGTCVPLAMAILAYRILLGRTCYILFSESFCRVQTLSFTGKLLYPWADLFLVHWKELHARYPRTMLSKSLVSSSD